MSFPTELKRDPHNSLKIKANTETHTLDKQVARKKMALKTCSPVSFGEKDSENEVSCQLYPPSKPNGVCGSMTCLKFKESHKELNIEKLEYRLSER